MFSRSVAVPEIVPPREMSRTCGRPACGESSPGGRNLGISCANAPAPSAQAKTNALTLLSILIEHPLDLGRVLRFREREAQQDACLLRIEVVGRDLAFDGTVLMQRNPARALAIAADDHDA